MKRSSSHSLGCDCTKENGRHFYDTQAGAAEILRPDVVFSSYRVCHQVFSADGRTLANAGVGGALDVLPRVSFESLFEEVTGSRLDAGYFKRHLEARYLG